MIERAMHDVSVRFLQKRTNYVKHLTDINYARHGIFDRCAFNGIAYIYIMKFLFSIKTIL